MMAVATPAGYWFLKGFEIDKIASSVTYMNMMCKRSSVLRSYISYASVAYDYHGPWDTNVTDQAPVTNPHTSILDIEQSALLYVRAGIDLSIGELTLLSP
jgi:chitinase